MDRKRTKTPKRKKEPENVSGWREAWGYIKVFLLAVLAAFLICHFVIVNAVVPTGSMENTILSHSRVIGNRLAYIGSAPQRGDIVIFHYPVDEKSLYIKRIIGLPGETVSIREGKIYINDSTEPLEEDYLPEEWVYANDGYTFQVPEDSYLVLGDNRNVSLDARFWAQEAVNAGLASNLEEAQSYTYVARDKIVAKAVLVYWPPSQIHLIKHHSYQ